MLHHALGSYIYYLILFPTISPLKKRLQYWDIRLDIIAETTAPGCPLESVRRQTHVALTPQSSSAGQHQVWARLGTICSCLGYTGSFAVFNMYILLPILEIKPFLDFRDTTSSPCSSNLPVAPFKFSPISEGVGPRRGEKLNSLYSWSLAKL